MGDVEEDPDFAGRGVSWCAPLARIVSVEETSVRLTPYEVTERTGPYTSWTDGSPVYTAEGRYLPSPEQVALGRPHPMFAVVPPWTPVEFINAWISGQPSGNRPSPSHPGVLISAIEAGHLLMRHVARAISLMERGVEFSTHARPYLDSINSLLDGKTVVRVDDTRGIVFASHPRDGVIAALVLTVATFDTQVGTQVGMFIDAMAVAPAWQHQGVGSVLLVSANQPLPAQPTFAAGHCDPKTAPFFAQAGYTVLRPGAQLPVILGEEPQLFGGLDDECWFYRQGPI